MTVWLLGASRHFLFGKLGGRSQSESSFNVKSMMYAEEPIKLHFHHVLISQYHHFYRFISMYFCMKVFIHCVRIVFWRSYNF